MSVPYHRPISAQLTQDEDHFLKGMPESILPPPSTQQQKRSNGGEMNHENGGDLSDEQLMELKRYRGDIKSLGRELSNLQATVNKLEAENQSLRKSSTSDEKLMSVVMTDPNVEVDSPEQFVERYVALKTKLEADLAEFKKYKDKVQKLQNQLIKAHDREKNFLNFEVAQTRSNEEVVKPINRERQRFHKLQNTVTQQENVIRNLEKGLRDYLDRTERKTSAKSTYSSASSKTRQSVTIRDPHQNEILKLMEENARLREEVGELRISIQQDDLKSLQLNDDLALSEQRIESLEAQLTQNAGDWRCEKRELTVTGAEDQLSSGWCNRCRLKTCVLTLWGTRDTVYCYKTTPSVQ